MPRSQIMHSIGVRTYDQIQNISGELIPLTVPLPTCITKVDNLPEVYRQAAKRAKPY